MSDQVENPYVSRTRQHTVAAVIACRGVGLHSGADIDLTIRPAAARSGIRFRRSDIEGGTFIPATWRHVVDGRRATTIGDGAATIATIEHLMAALAACAVDNAEIDVAGPELPAMDGSAGAFVEAIEAVGTTEQPEPRRAIVIRKRIEVEDGDRRASLAPADAFSIGFSIAYPHPAIGRQSFDADSGDVDYRREICTARTFCMAEEIEALRAHGLGLGGSLDNTLVVGPDGLVNPGGLRFEDEFVRHKVLDCLGDLYLAGCPLIGRFEGDRSGHATTHAVLRALFEDGDAWQDVPLN